MKQDPAKQSGWAPVYQAVQRIPRGFVSTYGTIAAVAGTPGAARQVGWALNALDADHDVPWHRVINAQGRISSRGEREFGDLQRARLTSEGVRFDDRGRVDLAVYGWQPWADPQKNKPARKAAERLVGRGCSKARQEDREKNELGEHEEAGHTQIREAAVHIFREEARGETK